MQRRSIRKKGVGSVPFRLVGIKIFADALAPFKQSLKRICIKTKRLLAIIALQNMLIHQQLYQIQDVAVRSILSFVEITANADVIFRFLLNAEHPSFQKIQVTREGGGHILCRKSCCNPRIRVVSIIGYAASIRNAVKDTLVTELFPERRIHASHGRLYAFIVRYRCQIALFHQ